MRKSLLLVAALLMVTGSLVTVAPASASPEKGMLAVGTTMVGYTPVGIRYWFGPKAGLDVEIGFWSNDVPTGSGGLETEFKGQIGVPINLICCSDAWLHLRPFILFDSQSFEGGGDSLTDIYFGAVLELEAWLTECISFSVWHGLVIESLDGGSGGESRTNIHLEGASLGNAGFHFYF